MKFQFTKAYEDLFDVAKSQSSEPGSKLGCMARNGAETVNVTAKAGAEMVVVCTVVSVGMIAGFAQGFWRGVASLPKA